MINKPTTPAQTPEIEVVPDDPEDTITINLGVHHFMLAFMMRTLVSDGPISMPDVEIQVNLGLDPQVSFERHFKPDYWTASLRDTVE